MWPSVDEWINKIRHIHTVGYYGALKITQYDTCRNMEEPQEHICYVKAARRRTAHGGLCDPCLRFPISLRCPDKTIHRDRKQISGCQVRERRKLGVAAKGHSVSFSGDEMSWS